MSSRVVFNEDFFNIVDTEEKAYWLGFLYADGCVLSGIYGNSIKTYELNRIYIQLNKKDIGHLDKWHKAISSSASICVTSLGSVQSSHHSKAMCNDLIKLGCIPNKSLVLKFPSYEQVPKEFVRHFVRGYFDGDGCISYRYNGRNNIREYV